MCVCLCVCFRGLFFIFFFPLFQILVFFASVGGDPKGLVLGIVNEEIYTNCSQPPPLEGGAIANDLNKKNWSHYAQYIVPETIEDEGYCELSDIGCMFLQHINNSVAYKVIILYNVYYLFIYNILRHAACG